MSLRNRSPIPKPFHHHSWIIDRRQRCLEVSALPLGQMFYVLQWPSEFRSLGDDQILFFNPFVTRIVFKVLYFLQSAFVLRFANNRGASCNLAFLFNNPKFLFFFTYIKYCAWRTEGSRIIIERRLFN